jgi:hypothetical protein
MFDRIKEAFGLNRQEYKSYLQPVDLAQEISLSGLSAAQINLIQRTSAGVFSIYDFIEHRRNSRYRDPLGKDVYAFSLTRYNNIPANSSVSKALRLISWSEAYDRLGLWKPFEEYLRDPRNDPNQLFQTQTKLFLNTLNTFRSPRAFFLPRNVLSDSRAEFLKYEVEYSLATPEVSLPLSYFVFGLDQIMSESTQENLPTVKSKSILTKESEDVVDKNLVASIINSYTPGMFASAT